MVFGGLLTSAVAADKLEKRKSPKGAKAYIIFPKDGKTVKKKFTVRFGLKGMGVAPAAIDKENTGHHHLLIDVDKLPNLDTFSKTDPFCVIYQRTGGFGAWTEIARTER